MDRYTVAPIGILHCDIRTRDEAPYNYTDSREKGVIEIFGKYTAGLEGMKVGDDILVLFWFHKSRRNVIRVHPRGDRRRKIRGVFTTRCSERPNPVAASRLKVTGLRGNKISVAHVDAVDGTPVLDIKKYR